MQIFRQEITFDRFIRGTLFVALLALFVAGINWLSAVLLPFFAAWAIAWILAPVVNFLYVVATSRPRFLAVILTLSWYHSHCGGGFMAHCSAISRRYSPHQRCPLALSAK